MSTDLLRLWVAAVMVTQDVAQDHAVTVAEVLVEANLRGVDSHGIMRAPVYHRRLLLGLVNPRPVPKVVSSVPSFVVLDGDNGPGPVVAAHAMRLCMDLARAQGAAFVAVRNSNHFGMAAHYVLMAARAGMFGMALSNAEANMAPFGGTAARFGTNPIALGVPGGPHGAAVLDIATSAAAFGKIALLADQDRPMPPGWALDRHGLPTTDPRAALDGGLALPFGGHKGSGLAFFVDILCGVFSGGLTSTEVGNLYSDLDRPQGVSHLFAAVDPGQVGNADAFRARVTDKAISLAATPALPGERVAWPGQLEDETAAERQARGIPLAPSVVAELRALGERSGVPFPA